MARPNKQIHVLFTEIDAKVKKQELTVKEAVKILHCSTATYYKWRKVQDGESNG